MKILLTNDDGISSNGIKKMEDVLKKYGDVYVVAPRLEQSGRSCSIQAHKGVNVDIVDERHIQVEGSPVDCVEVGFALTNLSFDIVVSGCNNGHNLANDVMYSGTCGACIQALFTNTKAIAFSCFNENYFYQIDEEVPKVMDFILKNKILSSKYFLNVNFPTTKQSKGIKITKIEEPIYEKYRSVLIDRQCIVNRKNITKNLDEDSDVYAINNGYISITPLSQTNYKDQYYEFLKNRVK